MIRRTMCNTILEREIFIYSELSMEKLGGTLHKKGKDYVESDLGHRLGLLQ